MRSGWIMVLMAGLLITPVSVSAEATMKIGVVDFQKAMELSSEGKAAKAVFQKEVERIQRDLKGRQDELNKLKEEIELQGAMLTPEARAEKQRQYENKLRDFKRLYEDYQEEMRREDAQLSEKILRKLMQIIEVYGEANGYDLILEKTQSAVLYKSELLDITLEIIREYDKAPKTP